MEHVSLSDIEWGDFADSGTHKELVNNLAIRSNNKTIYGIAVGLLLEKIEHPLRNICLVSDKPKEKHGWGSSGFNLPDVVRKEVGPFLKHMKFEEAPSGMSSFPTGKIKYYCPGVAYGENYCEEADVTDPFMFSLMRMVHNVEKKGESPEMYLEAFFTRSIYKRIEMQEERNRFFMNDSKNIRPREALSLVDLHRDPCSYSKEDHLNNISNLPVRAIWTYFEQCCEEEKVLGFLTLDMYNPHTATDTIDSPGDICLRDKRNGLVYECIDVKGYGKRLTWDEVSSALSDKIIPAIEIGSLKGGYTYIYTDEPSAAEKADIERHLSEVSEKYGRSLSLISFDDFFSRDNYRRLSEISCNGWLDKYREEVLSNKYNELPHGLRTKLMDIYKDAGIATDSEDSKKVSQGIHEDLSSEASLTQEAVQPALDILDEDELEK